MTTADQRPVYQLTLRAPPGPEGIRALRRFLKCALRSYGLVCVRAVELPAVGADRPADAKPDAAPPAPAPDPLVQRLILKGQAPGSRPHNGGPS